MASNVSEPSRAILVQKMFRRDAVSLGIKAERLKEEQKGADVYILERIDTFISLLTEFGEELLYQIVVTVRACM